MAKRRRPSAARRQAKTEANIRFGPEKRALADLLYQAQADLHTGLRQERGAAAGVQAAISAAAPELASHYAEATGGLNTANAMLQKDMSTLGASADPYKAVAANEAAAARRRLGSAMARAQTDLSQQKVRAAEGRVFGERQQRAEYGGKVDKFAKTAQGLASEAGEFEAGALRDILEANRKADLENRKLGETRRSNRARERGAGANRKLTRRGQDITRLGDVEENDRAKTKAGKGKGRSAPGYGRTNVSLAKAVTARQQWEGILRHPRNADKPPRGNQFLIRAAVEFHDGKGKVSKRTALKVYRTFGFRLPYSKPRNVPQRLPSVVSPW